MLLAVVFPFILGAGVDADKPDLPSQQQRKSFEPEMVFVKGGMFKMGSPSTETGRDDDEGPVHEVTVGDFYLGKCEVTFAQYDKFWMTTGREGPGHKGWGRGNRPVIFVSWVDAVDYCEWLSEQTGKKYRLPTEAEWEYACRAGTSTPYSFGNSAADPEPYGWYRNNSEKKTQPVGQQKPNPWGLYDMHGNVSEWCADRYVPYTAEKQADPEKPSSRNWRVLRGGSWHDLPADVRSARRNKSGDRFSDTDIGFRVAQDP